MSRVTSSRSRAHSALAYLEDKEVTSHPHVRQNIDKALKFARDAGVSVCLCPKPDVKNFSERFLMIQLS